MQMWMICEPCWRIVMAEGLARTASERGWLHPASPVEGATQAPEIAQRKATQSAADGLPEQAIVRTQNKIKKAFQVKQQKLKLTHHLFFLDIPTSNRSII